ncbi:MAG: restriction endonuclease subunit S [Planctomycetes bacterium]|nr:restriction endonuclease subunit S [Planctomycetota bacterium]
MTTIPLSAVLLELESGRRPKGGAVQSGVPSLGAEHLDGLGGFAWHSPKYVPVDFYAGLPTGRIEHEDILVVKDGATTGKVSFVNGSFPFPKAAINEHVFRLKVDPKKACARFVFRFLASPQGQQQILSDFRGATVGGISRGFVEKVDVPRFDVDEQERLAAILDKADGVRRKRREAIKLADDLLRATFLEMFGDPVTNPKRWDVGVLDDVVDSDDTLNYGVVQPGDDVPDGVPLIRAAEVVSGLTAASNFKRITSEIESQYERSRIRGNEVLIVCVGSIGAVAEVRSQHVGHNIARAVARVPVSGDIEREFVADYLRTQRVQNYFINETRTVSQPTLNIKQIKQTPIYLPDRPARKRYVKTRLRITAALERCHLAAVDSEALFNSLMQRAFTGRQ